MDYKTYQGESKRTCPKLSDNLREGLADEMHMAIGISTEAGELLDAYKKHFAYGKELDVVNVGEELADIMWYTSNLCGMLDIDLEEMLQRNIDKLKARYPDKFTQENAMNRNLDVERKILEGKNAYEFKPLKEGPTKGNIKNNPQARRVAPPPPPPPPKRRRLGSE